MNDRHDVFPAVSVARTETRLLPMYTGIAAMLQVSVPVPFPLSPPEVDQVIDATGRLPLAVPDTAIVANDVVTIVPAGERIVIEGGVVSAGPGAGGTGGGDDGAL